MSKKGDSNITSNSSYTTSSSKHWSSEISTALSNFVVQYNYGSMSCALLIMASSVCTFDDDTKIYSDCDMKGEQREWVEPTSNSIVYLGSILGQLTLGFCGDYFGRTIALAIALFLTTVGAFFSAVAPPYDNEKSVSIYVVIIFFRFLMGVGVGAIFPLTATKAAEDAGDTKHVTRITSGETEFKQLNLIAASWGYFWQMPGILAPWLMMLLLNLNNN
jgi:PHS family inorganic phosphate transporter-like MFS transporter